MKKTILLMGMIVCVLLSSVAGVFAAENAGEEDGSYVIYHEDGGYTVVSHIERTVTPSLTRSTTRIVFAKRDATHYDADGNVVWVYTLRAYFDYVEGVSVECTDAMDSYDIEDSSWEFAEGEAVCAGNQAIASATFEQKVLFVTTKTVPVTITITCDEYGNLS